LSAVPPARGPWRKCRIPAAASGAFQRIGFEPVVEQIGDRHRHDPQQVLDALPAHARMRNDRPNTSAMASKPSPTGSGAACIAIDSSARQAAPSARRNPASAPRHSS
jgi:hypothetical protein